MVDVASLDPDTAQDGQNAPALFEVTSTVGAYGSRNYTFTEPVDVDVVRGPGPRPPTTGPRDAQAPAWWAAEAERLVLRLVREHGQVTSDDVRAVYSDEPSATGAAIGALFKRLGRQGRLTLVAHRPSIRPEARGRVVGVWTRGGVA